MNLINKFKVIWREAFLYSPKNRRDVLMKYKKEIEEALKEIEEGKKENGKENKNS